MGRPTASHRLGSGTPHHQRARPHELPPQLGRPPIILVTGAGGQVGRALARVLPEARFLGRAQLDVTDPGEVTTAIDQVDVVIHLAAMTNVDRCESEPHLAHLVNATGTAHVATAALQSPSRVIYVSTDYVFDGMSRSEYKESDATNPLNVYGVSKRDGETEVARVPNHLIIRTSWVFGEGRNFVDTILSRARGGGPLRVIDDQIARPTSADALALAICYLIDRGERGTVHVTGDGPVCSWAELACCALSAAGIESEVERITTDSYRASSTNTVAPRPANSTLCLDRARSLKVPLLDWRESVRHHLGRIA